MDGQVTVEGIVESIIFASGDTGYTVFEITAVSGETENDDGAEDLVCVGYVHGLSEGETVTVRGKYVVHPAYGKQLQVQEYRKEMPASEKGIEKYLASGIIKGIGAGFAKKIVAEFGCDSLRVMAETPEKLSEIKGISIQKALAIGAVYSEKIELGNVIIKLQEYGISPVYAYKIYKRYKENAIDIVENNPYSLADDIFGVGFKICDNIAFKAGVSPDSTYRIRAGIKYELNRALSNGHVYFPSGKLVERASELLGIPDEIVEAELLELHMVRQIWIENTDEGKIVYLNSVHYAESFVAKKLIELSAVARPVNIDYAVEIESIEKEKNITLAAEQRRAVREAMKNNVMVLTGGPGTGKTTTINAIIELLNRENFDMELAAPTGRAAKKMTEATGVKAQTIHRLLGISFVSDDSRRQSFDKDEENPLETDVVIIDESSMVDILLMNSLLKAIPEGTKLILVGDANQLPSVGPGNVLKDIINSGCIKVVELTEIFRQARQSAIVMNAHRINRGEYPVLNEKRGDFFFIKKYSIDDLTGTIVDLASERLPNYKNYDSLRDIQVLTPMRKSPAGVLNLNRVLQGALNPPHFSKKEKEFRSVVFREGDKVMQVKNNYNMVWREYSENGRQTDEGIGVFNGDEGIIMNIDEDAETIRVSFDDNKIVNYDFSQLDELELSYAVTIHKSQGSEYKAVVIPLHSGPEMLLSRNLLYTAVTRARELAVIVGMTETIHKMVDNNREVNRYTSLCRRIKEMHGILCE